VLGDTIVAIATAPGEAALAVVRLSGPNSGAVLRRVFRPARRTRLASGRLVYGWVVHPGTGERLDEVLAVNLPGAATYTGEPSAEIHCHGGRLSPQRVLEAALLAGARLADPGEFTLRAFLNGRVDLARAEAVLDVIQARSERAHRLALAGLAGRLSQAVRLIRQRLIGAQAYLEASIDFSEEELTPEDVTPALRAALEGVRRLLVQAEQGIVYREGYRVAIVGRPNVGKSSLLNALLRSERAIVTPLPGTTRDTVEESCVLDGVPFWLVDTAGLRRARNAAEQDGIARSRAAVQSADLLLVVLDRSRRRGTEDRELLAAAAKRRALIVANKSDLPAAQAGARPLVGGAQPLAVSARSGAGLEALERALVSMARGQDQPADPYVSNQRHRDALRRAESALLTSLDAAEAGLPDDILAGEVASAAQALGEITGENSHEDLLDAIFSRFCLGK
jgi:tRNA modification GTPase